MLKGHNFWLRAKITRTKAISASLLVLCGLTLSIFLLQQHTANQPTAGVLAPTIEVDMGFDANYRSDYWTPVRVNLYNGGPAFTGTLSVGTYTSDAHSSPINDASNDASPWHFEQDISLRQNAHKQLTLYAPHYFNYAIARGFIATLKNQFGNVVTKQTSEEGSEVKPGDLFVGILGNPDEDFTTLDKVLLPNQANILTRATLDVSTMPTEETVLENFDVIVVDNFATRDLNHKQIAALQTWVNRGGVLLEVGGSNWQKTLAPLPKTLVPVTLQGTTLLPAQTHLLPVSGPVSTAYPPTTDIPETAIPASNATLSRLNAFSSNEVLLTQNNHPLIVQAHQGAGIICYLGFDPATAPLATHPQTSQIWQVVLTHALGNTLLIPNTTENYDTGPGQVLTRGGLLLLVEPTLPLTPWIIAFLLLGYIIVLGPVRLFLQKRLQLPSWWKWRIVVSCIIIFTLLSYGLASLQKNTALFDNSISLTQINQDGSAAHITTYTGIYLPDQNRFNVQIPGANLTEPIGQQFLEKNPALNAHKEATTTIDTGSDQTNLTLQASGLWTLNPIVTEQDSQLQGRLTSHLAIQNNRLIGQIVNTFSTALTDVYVLYPHSFASIGHLAAGQTLQVNQLINSTTAGSGQTLANQLAIQAGLAANYLPNMTGKQALTERQKHIALLSALSGTGFTYAPCSDSCQTHALINKGNIYITGGQVPNPKLKTDYDPLLVKGSSATLIGWADQPLNRQNNTTINGQIPAGTHMNFVQMPLNLNFQGTLHMPTDFITGNAVDIQSYDASAVLPGIYSLSTGNVTFELTMPDTTQMHVQSLTVGVPDLIAHPAGPGSGITTRASDVQTHFYNWKNSSWDLLKLQQDNFTTTDLATYAGPQGRVLIQVNSLDASQIFFGKPTLSLSSATS